MTVFLIEKNTATYRAYRTYLLVNIEQDEDDVRVNIWPHSDRGDVVNSPAQNENWKVMRQTKPTERFNRIASWLLALSDFQPIEMNKNVTFTYTVYIFSSYSSILHLHFYHDTSFDNYARLKNT